MDCMVWSKGLGVQVGGHGVVSYAGPAATRLLADRADWGAVGYAGPAGIRPGA